MSSNEADKWELQAVNLAASCLSLFGSAAIILNYIIFINKSQLLYKLILFLSVADFGGSLTICISQILLFLHTYDKLSYDLDLCKFFRAGVNFFFVSSFFWTAGIALHFWVSARQKAQIPIYWFHGACWGIPAIFTIILISSGMIRREGGPWCTNTALGHWLFWYGPLIASFLWNAVAYTLIIMHYRGSDRQKMKHKITRRVSMYLLVFFVCWVWDMVGFLIQEGAHHAPPFWIQVLTSGFMPLQGFLNFMVYGISSRMFRRQPAKLHKRPSYTRSINNDENRSLLSI